MHPNNKSNSFPNDAVAEGPQNNKLISEQRKSKIEVTEEAQRSSKRKKSCLKNMQETHLKKHQWPLQQKLAYQANAKRRIISGA